jgi:hypothetical protein
MFKIKADRLSREAWMHLGKAREMRWMVRFSRTEHPFINEDEIAHAVYIAKGKMRTAIAYRNIGRTA